MRKEVPELKFTERKEFRAWMRENAKTSGGIWLVFGKTKEVVTLSARDALEEALCFGWVDGKIKSIDNTTYLKYFSRRRGKSPWSEKNKRLVGALRGKKLMTELGEKAVKKAIKNGTWNVLKGNQITDKEVKEFAEKLYGISPAYENFNKMSRSVRLTYTRRYYSFKSEEARERYFEKIVDRLNNNLKPM